MTEPAPELPSEKAVDEEKNEAKKDAPNSVELVVSPAQGILLAPLGPRPVTNNWLSLPFVMTCLAWVLVAIVCGLNFWLAGIMVSAGHYVMAAVNGLYALLMVWIFGSTLIGAPATFLAVRQLEKRNFFVAEQAFTNYLDLVKRLKLHKDGHYQVATANLALIKLSRGDYHHAEVLYEDLIAKNKSSKRLANHGLTAVYINNLAGLKVAQAVLHEELFDLELSEAERLANEALAIWRGAGGKKSSGEAAYPLQLLAEIYILRGQLPEAEKALSESIELNGGAKQSAVILPEARQGLYFESHFWLGLLLLKQGKKDQADKIIAGLIDQLRKSPAPVLQHSMLVLNLITREYVEMGALAEAENVVSFAYSVARGYPVHPEAQEIAHTFEDILIKTDRKDEIADMKLWIRPVLELGLDGV
ncbi:MAG: hypothetical protein JST01_22160 [Cyanobacteria bacterium SZAS TMP-1]|nr:hypothetical protein [Cyanobacteria bacterium SZAS TMP-1]